MKEINAIRFKKVLLSELKAAPYNPRKKLKPEDPEFERIARSIEEFGYVDPIIINSDNTVIGGHQRVAVLKHKGYAACDAVVVDLDKTREKALNVALNKISGEWDFTLLKEVLESLKDEDFDISLTGFDDAELRALLMDSNQGEPKDDDELKSVPLKSAFEIIIECQDEAEQERIFNELTKGGYKCRVLTL